MAEPRPDVDALRELAFFEDVPDSHLTLVAGCAHWEDVPEGAVILREGERADALRVIVHGRVNLSIRVPGLHDETISTLSRGELVGVSALFPGRAWTGTATALKPCRFVAIPSADFHALCERDHELGWFMMRHALGTVAARLHDTRLQLLDMFHGEG